MFCAQSFGDGNNLEVHLETVHSEEITQTENIQPIITNPQCGELSDLSSSETRRIKTEDINQLFEQHPLVVRRQSGESEINKNDKNKLIPIATYPQIDEVSDFGNPENVQTLIKTEETLFFEHNYLEVSPNSGENPSVFNDLLPSSSKENNSKEKYFLLLLKPSADNSKEKDLIINLNSDTDGRSLKRNFEKETQISRLNDTSIESETDFCLNLENGLAAEEGHNEDVHEDRHDGHDEGEEEENGHDDFEALFSDVSDDENSEKIKNKNQSKPNKGIREEITIESASISCNKNLGSLSQPTNSFGTKVTKRSAGKNGDQELPKRARLENSEEKINQATNTIKDKEEDSEEENYGRVCVLCQQVVQHRGVYVHHINTVLNDEGFFVHVCDVCGKSFDKKYLACKHVSRVHVSKDLKRLKSRKKQADYKCKVCNEQVSRDEDKASHHIETCTLNDKAVFYCNICSKDFEQYKTCFNHVCAKHLNLKDEKSDLSRDTLFCVTCRKFVSESEIFSHHIRRFDFGDESGTVLFTCDLCSQDFFDEDSCQRHLKEIH